MTPTEEIIRGDEAQRLVTHPLFRDAVASVREGIVSALSSSPMGDSQTHNRLAIALQLLGQIEKQLVSHIETGKMAQIQVEEKRGLRRVFG